MRYGQIAKETRRSGFWLFLLQGKSYLGDHAARAKTSSLAAFAVTLFCFIIQDVPTLEMALDQNLASEIAYRAVHSPTLDSVETVSGPS